MMSFMQNSGIMGGSNHASTSGTLPSNTIPNPRNECKGITTRSGVVLDGPLPPMPPPYVNPDNEKAKETEVTKDKVQPESSQSTANVQPRVDHGKGKDKLKDNEKGMNEKEKDDEAFLKDLQGLNSRLRGKSSDKGLYGMDSAISHIFPNNNLEDSFKMGDEDLNFIPNKELDKEDLIPIPRESKIGKECDFPLCDDFQKVHKETLKSYLNPLFEDDEEIISIEVSRQISPKVNSEPSIDDMSFSPKELNLESLPKDDFDNDDDLFEMDSNNDEWKRILYGEDFERMDSNSDKTKDFDKSSSSVFKSLSDEFEPGGSSYVEGNDLVCYEDFHVSDALFSTINEDKVFNPGILVDKNSKVHEPNVLPTLPTRSSEMMLDFDLENFQVEPKNDILNPKVLVFDPGIFDNVLTRKSSLTLKIFDPPSIIPPLIDFHVTKALSGFTFSLLKLFSKKFFKPGIKNATVYLSYLVWGRIRLLEFLHPHFYPP
ncbi:hypothetical protein Tco_0116355 [Tanacetum coccineum]